MREEFSQVLIEPCKNVLNLPTSRSEGVPNVIHGGIAHAQEVGSRAGSELQFIHRSLGNSRQIRIGIRTSLPLIIENGIRPGTVWFAAQGMRKCRAQVRRGDRPLSCCIVEICS